MALWQTWQTNKPFLSSFNSCPFGHRSCELRIMLGQSLVTLGERWDWRNPNKSQAHWHITTGIYWRIISISRSSIVLVWALGLVNWIKNPAIGLSRCNLDRNHWFIITDNCGWSSYLSGELDMNSVTFHSMALVGQPAWLWLVADAPGDPRENGVRRRKE